MKWIGKILAIPLILLTSFTCLVMKVLTKFYGACYGLVGIGFIAAMILFVAYSEWRNAIALIIILLIAFMVLFFGTLIQVILEEICNGLKTFIRS